MSDPFVPPWEIGQRVLNALGLGHAQNVSSIVLTITPHGAEVVVHSLLYDNDRTDALTEILSRYRVLRVEEEPARAQ